MFNLIFNPVAGKKLAFKNLEIVTRILDARGIEYKLYKTGGIHDAEYIARKLTRSGDVTDIIVFGGDGTLNEVLNGISFPHLCNLGLIPCGTGNDFAANMQIPLDPKEAILRILENEAKPVDYIEVSGTRCMNVSGLGIDVDVLERCQRGKMRGKMKYLLSLLTSLFTFKGIDVSIEKENGETEERKVLICATCNGAVFGGGIKICPGAETSDEKMDVVIVDDPNGFFGRVNALLNLLQGKILEGPYSTHFKADAVKFIPKVPCPIQLDGEVYQNHDYSAKVCKGLRFY